MDFFLGEGACLLDPKFRKQVLLDIVGCTGLAAALPQNNQHRQDGLDDELKISLQHGHAEEAYDHDDDDDDHTLDEDDDEKQHYSLKNLQLKNLQLKNLQLKNLQLKNLQLKNPFQTVDRSESFRSISSGNGNSLSRRQSSGFNNNDDEGGDKKKRSMDPYCVVKLAKMAVHRTRPCADQQQGTNPIWTLNTKSLCILDIPNEQAMNAKVEGSPSSKLSRSKTLGHLDSGVVIEIRTGRRLLGHATLSFEQIWDICAERPGERLEVEFVLKQPHNNSDPLLDGPTKKSPLLAIRMRYATVDDEIFLGLRPAPPKAETTDSKTEADKLAAARDRKMHLEAADLEFKGIRGMGIFKSRKKLINGVKHYRVMPGPDPWRPVEDTEWMTRDQIKQECLKPSRNFVDIGTTGKIGKCYVEVLKCQQLPNLDVDYLNVGDKTDPFVALMFEDCLVRTDMLWDELSPEWMPWTMRAFCFHMRHPSSLLFLGAFDYDGGLDDHDGIGRVVINLGNFRPNTSYLLHYDLHHDPALPPEESKRGQITLRLRIEYPDEAEAAKASFQPPPKCIINCKTKKTYHVLKYLKHGPVDLDHGSMDSIKVYVGELTSYWIRICHFLDILFEVLLWRGRLRLSKNRSIYFPHHSLFLMASGLLCVEYPHLVGPTLLLSFSWMMLTIEFHLARHPDPWKRAKGVILLGNSLQQDVHIKPHDGVEESKKLAKFDKWRGERMSLLIAEVAKFFGELGKIKDSQKITSNFFVSNKASFTVTNMVLGKALEAPTMILKNVCKQARVFLRFINWDGYLANSVVLRCTGLALVWMVLPVNLIIWWALRILAWTLLGPWMKLFDIFFVHHWYMTGDELWETIEDGVEELEPQSPHLSRFLESEALAETTFKGRLVVEHASKYKAMRDHIFGKYSEFVPFLDDARFSSTPLPDSTAEPYHENPPVKKTVRFQDSSNDAEKEDFSTFVQSQKLKGNMIMEPYCRAGPESLEEEEGKDHVEAPSGEMVRVEGHRLVKDLAVYKSPSESSETLPAADPEDTTPESIYELKRKERENVTISARDYSNGEDSPSTVHYRRSNQMSKSITSHIKLD